MNARVARLERREAKRILGERGTSIVGAVRSEYLGVAERLDAYKTALSSHQHQIDVIEERLSRHASAVTRLIDMTFLQRARWLVTGQLPKVVDA